MKQNGGPGEKVENFLDNIEFTPPKKKGDYELTWDISYNQFPLYGKIKTEGNPYTHPQMDYLLNFTYSFDYSCKEDESIIDYTFDFPLLANQRTWFGGELMRALDGLGLSIPQFTYFITDADIIEEDKREDSEGKDLFSFMSEDTVVAQVDMANIKKKNYTLTNT